MNHPITKTESEWKALLKSKGAEPLAYHITRQAGTERAFSGKYESHKASGTYSCMCCNKPLFDAKTKYESGSGWPSFYQPLEDTALATRTDLKLPQPRTEVLCADCGAHLGHVFEDGPEPTGLRYCMNSASLNFHPE